MVYRLILSLRHLFYDKGWKKSFHPDIPTICVGNIAVGGTGKTPHTEMIIRKLQAAGYRPAVLSRGYKRKLRGFQLVPSDGTARLYGDEPVQIARKFPTVAVAVDKDRLQGCEGLTGNDAIVLDDAFQYRRLKASLNIVVVDYNHPPFKDRLLPWGRLRDLPSRLKKADMVVVSKGPHYLDEQEREQWRKNLGLRDETALFFTTLGYGTGLPVFPEGDSHYLYAKQVTVITGIADDTPLRNHLSDHYKIGQRLQFPDHHNYTAADIRTIAKAAKAAPTSCLITTEKDAQRLRCAPQVPLDVRKRLFYLPIEAVFLSEEEEAAFTQALLAVL